MRHALLTNIHVYDLYLCMLITILCRFEFVDEELNSCNLTGLVPTVSKFSYFHAANQGKIYRNYFQTSLR